MKKKKNLEKSGKMLIYIYIYIYKLSQQSTLTADLTGRLRTARDLTGRNRTARNLIGRLRIARNLTGRIRTARNLTGRIRRSRPVQHTAVIPGFGPAGNSKRCFPGGGESL